MRVKLSMLAGALAALVGCGHSSGFLPDARTAAESPCRAERVARRFARSVSGSSSIGSLLCLIPLRNGAYKDAMEALHAEAKLQPNEVLADIRADYASTPYVLYCEDNLILSADVYELVPARAEPEVPPAEAGACDPPYTVDRRGVEEFKPECLPDAREPTDTGACDPPYTVDRRGIQHFKLECLVSDRLEPGESDSCEPPYEIDDQARKHFKTECLESEPRESTGSGGCEPPYAIDDHGWKHFKPECVGLDPLEPEHP